LGTRGVPFFGSRSGKTSKEGMKMLAQLKRLLFEESGQGMVEYGLILALIALAVIVVLRLFGGQIKAIFENLNSELESELNP